MNSFDQDPGIGQTEFWNAEMVLGEPRDPREVWETIARYAQPLDTTVVATYVHINTLDVPPGADSLEDGLLQIHRWPDDRPDYAGTPDIENLEALAVDLAEEFGCGSSLSTEILDENLVQVVMGRRSGYERVGHLAPLSAYRTEDLRALPQWSAHLVHMLYVGVMENGLDDYTGDPMTLLRAERTSEAIAALHRLANGLNQHHYTIEAQIAASESSPRQSVIYAGDASQG